MTWFCSSKNTPYLCAMNKRKIFIVAHIPQQLQEQLTHEEKNFIAQSSFGSLAAIHQHLKKVIEISYPHLTRYFHNRELGKETCTLPNGVVIERRQTITVKNNNPPS